jgi:hypothetical protein
VGFAHHLSEPRLAKLVLLEGRRGRRGDNGLRHKPRLGLFDHLALFARFLLGLFVRDAALFYAQTSGRRVRALRVLVGGCASDRTKGHEKSGRKAASSIPYTVSARTYRGTSCHDARLLHRAYKRRFFGNDEGFRRERT